MSLELKNLNTSYNGVPALKDINLTVSDGMFLSLLGPSGSGKSTLLKSIAGLIGIDAGNISLNGQRIEELPPNKRDISLVFQDLRLFPHLNVEDNVAFPLKVKGFSKQERLKSAREMLEQVQLQGLQGRRVQDLSGGQQQRVVLARALAAQPKVLLLDEPLSSLDSNLRSDLQDLLADLNKNQGITIVMVTHDQSEALMLSDHIAIMHEGQILQCAKPEYLYENPQSLDVARYFCGGNQIVGKISEGWFESDCLKFATHYPEGRYFALIRPEDLSISEGDEFELTREVFLGDRVSLVFSCGDTQLKTSIAKETKKIQVGDKVNLNIPPERILLYSA